jgi:hypothetical protein
MKMETVYSSETSVYVYKTTPRHITADNILRDSNQHEIPDYKNNLFNVKTYNPISVLIH